MRLGKWFLGLIEFLQTLLVLEVENQYQTVFHWLSWSSIEFPSLLWVSIRDFILGFLCFHLSHLVKETHRFSHLKIFSNTFFFFYHTWVNTLWDLLWQDFRGGVSFQRIPFVHYWSVPLWRWKCRTLVREALKTESHSCEE